MAIRRAEQEKIMRRIRKILTSVLSYGGHTIIETPWASAFWKQYFCTDLETDFPSNRNRRDFKFNICRAGSSHFKALQFCTTLLEAATEHTQGLTCDHGLKHTLCVGVDAEGS